MVGGVDQSFDAMEEALLGDTVMLYNEFPELPDFPCMSSSSSSSSSTPALSKPMMSSSSSSSSSSGSSSAQSWSILKSDGEEEQRLAAVGTPAGPVATTEMAAVTAGEMDCMDVVENLGIMDLFDTNEMWDPASLFQTENTAEFQQLQNQEQQQEQGLQPLLEGQFIQEPRPTDELGSVFFEWLKSNKEFISVEDMRNIKIKKSTVDSAEKRLGSTTEGKKQLLKLILEWVEQFQLQKKKMGEPNLSNSSQFPNSFQYQEPPIENPNLNPNANPNLTGISVPQTPVDPNACFSPAPWVPPPPTPYSADPSGFMVAPSPVCATPYMADPYLVMNGQPVYQPPLEYQTHMLETTPTWPAATQYAPMTPAYSGLPGNNGNTLINNNFPVSQGYVGYGDQVPYQYYNTGGTDKLARLGSSATKEARKKRMARQRRFVSHSRHHQTNNNSNHSVNQNQIVDQQVRHGSENCGDVNQGNWGYWQGNGNRMGSGSSGMAPAVISDGLQNQNQSYQHRPNSADGRQGWKHEKNLKFLLQKVLKQSDVGNLGRIVLPKKEAETHLPGLDSRDGIPIAMEDVGTSRVWNMRYRFWPNNKSRMYLLENTGDFVRANGLQEGDFIVLYTDIKSNKYLIRGVKVRQGGQKSETSNKKPVKNIRGRTNGSCSPQTSQRIECI